MNSNSIRKYISIVEGTTTARINLNESDWDESGWTEIEFVCVNPNHADATPLDKQEELFDALQDIPNTIVIRQDWSHMEDGQSSLSILFKDDDTRQQILDIANTVGVEIDVEDSVSDSYVDNAIRGRLEGQY